MKRPKYKDKETVEKSLKKIHDTIDYGEQTGMEDKFKTYNKHTLLAVSFDEIESTHKAAQLWADCSIPDNFGVLLTSKKQTAGFGNKGSTWESPEGNIYLSLIISANINMNLPLSTTGVALAIKKFLSKRFSDANVDSSKIQIKWPNDVYVDNKKIAGVLLSSAGTCKNTSTSSINRIFLVVSVGLNVNEAPKTTIETTSISENTNTKDINIEEAIDELIPIILETIQLDDETLIPLVQENLLYAEEDVEIFDPFISEATLEEGKFIGINEEGFAILLDSNKEKHIITRGKMRLKPKQIQVNEPKEKQDETEKIEKVEVSEKVESKRYDKSKYNCKCKSLFSFGYNSRAFYYYVLFIFAGGLYLFRQRSKK